MGYIYTLRCMKTPWYNTERREGMQRASVIDVHFLGPDVDIVPVFSRKAPLPCVLAIPGDIIVSVPVFITARFLV